VIIFCVERGSVSCTLYLLMIPHTAPPWRGNPGDERSDLSKVMAFYYVHLGDLAALSVGISVGAQVAHSLRRMLTTSPVMLVDHDGRRRRSGGTERRPSSDEVDSRALVPFQRLRQGKVSTKVRRGTGNPVLVMPPALEIAV
jgi:hypothetical protein